MRPIALSMCLLPRRTENEGLHRLGKTFIVVGSRDGRGLRLDLVRGVTHGDAAAGALEHQHVVWLIADGRNLLRRHAEVLHEIFHHGALVRVLVGDVEANGLRPVGGRMRAKCSLRLGFAALHLVVIVAHADDPGSLMVAISSAGTPRCCTRYSTTAPLFAFLLGTSRQTAYDRLAGACGRNAACAWASQRCTLS